MATTQSLNPVVIAVPINRDYVDYGADAGSMTLTAGAFPSGSLSNDTEANVRAEMLVFAGLGSAAGSRASVGVEESERSLGAESHRTVVGTPVRVNKIERHTKGLSLRGKKLFSFAADNEAMVAALQVNAAKAAQFKGSLKTALVIVPEAPYVLSRSMAGAKATAQKPVQYTELATVILAVAKCGLVIDGQSRVLASIDVGTPDGAVDGK